MAKIKKKLKIEGMHCSSCAMMIEGELEDIGVTAKCSFAAQIVEVEFDNQKISDGDIAKAIQKAGYKIVAA